MIQSKQKLIEDLWMQLVAARYSDVDEPLFDVEIRKLRSRAIALAEIMLSVQQELSEGERNVRTDPSGDINVAITSSMPKHRSGAVIIGGTADRETDD